MKRYSALTMLLRAHAHATLPRAAAAAHIRSNSRQSIHDRWLRFISRQSSCRCYSSKVTAEQEEQSSKGSMERTESGREGEKMEEAKIPLLLNIHAPAHSSSICGVDSEQTDGKKGATGGEAPLSPPPPVTHRPPQHPWVSHKSACDDFLLTGQDLHLLEDTGRIEGDTKLYPRALVEQHAIKRHGSLALLAQEKKRRVQEKLQSPSASAPLAARSRLTFHWMELLKAQRRVRKDKSVKEWIKAEVKMWEGSQKTVNVAIVTNSLVMCGKWGAFVVTGSGAMFAEALHSVADVVNQIFLAIGLRRSLKQPDPMHPYGYGSELCGASMYHGIASLITPVAVHSVPVALFVLTWSFLLESYSLYVAVSEVRKASKKTKMPLIEYIKNGPDPVGTAVLLEDVAAVSGVVIAATALSIGHFTSPGLLETLDATGSLMIGGLLGSFASFLIQKNRDFLTNKSPPQSQIDSILKVLTADPVIHSVHDVKVITMGAETIRFKADIQFNGANVATKYIQNRVKIDDALKEVQKFRTARELESFLRTHGDGLIDFVGDELDRLERNIRQRHPEAKFIELEIM